MFKRLFPRKHDASLDSVTFDCVRYRYQGEADGRRTWFTPEGDGVGLFFFPKTPDLPAGARSATEVRDFYRRLIGDEPTRILEFNLLDLDGVRCVWLLLKVPQEPHGMSYVGSITVPFAGFSFVVKMQCAERGNTGARETVLFLNRQQDGTVATDENGKITGDWNPDHERNDVLFPDHPVSRLRREFACIRDSLRINEQTKSERRFELPGEPI